MARIVQNVQYYRRGPARQEAPEEGAVAAGAEVKAAVGEASGGLHPYDQVGTMEVVLEWEVRVLRAEREAEIRRKVARVARKDDAKA